MRKASLTVRCKTAIKALFPFFCNVVCIYLFYLIDKKKLKRIKVIQQSTKETPRYQKTRQFTKNRVLSQMLQNNFLFHPETLNLYVWQKILIFIKHALMIILKLCFLSFCVLVIIWTDTTLYKKNTYCTIAKLTTMNNSLNDLYISYYRSTNCLEK